jgi:hypothetical protein
VGVTHAALCTQADLYVSKDSKARKISEALGECRQTPADISANAKFQCYLNAETGCDNVPTTTGSGPLRELYNHLQSTAHCDDKLEEMDIERPSRDVLIRLIFEKQVRENFQANYKVELADFDERATRLKLPANLRLSDLASLSRKDFLSRITQIQDALIKSNAQGSSVRQEAEDFQAMAEALRDIRDLAKSDADSIPFGWVEPHAVDSKEKPAFYDLSQARFIARVNEMRRTSETKDAALTEAAPASVEYQAALKLRTQAEAKITELTTGDRNVALPPARMKALTEAMEARDKAYEATRTTYFSSPERRALVVERVKNYSDEVARLKAEKAPLSVVAQSQLFLEKWKNRLPRQ